MKIDGALSILGRPYRKLVMVDTKIDAVAERREWLEPVVSELAVEDTAGFPRRGSDGGRNIDCTLS